MSPHQSRRQRHGEEKKKKIPSDAHSRGGDPWKVKLSRGPGSRLKRGERSSSERQTRRGGGGGCSQRDARETDERPDLGSGCFNHAPGTRVCRKPSVNVSATVLTDTRRSLMPSNARVYGRPVLPSMNRIWSNQNINHIRAEVVRLERSRRRRPAKRLWRNVVVVVVVVVEVLLYVHRNRWLISDGSPGRPPRREMLCVVGEYTQKRLWRKVVRDRRRPENGCEERLCVVGEDSHANKFCKERLCVVNEDMQTGSEERLCVVSEDIERAVKKGCAWSTKTRKRLWRKVVHGRWSHAKRFCYERLCVVGEPAKRFC